MKTVFVCLFICLQSLFGANAQNNGKFEYFFKARPAIDSDTKGLVAFEPIWEFKPTVQIPAIKITESTRANAKADATFLASAGGGLTFQKTKYKDNKYYAGLSFSGIILLTGDTSKDDPLDLSVCATVGGFNNLLQLGIGYDLGTVTDRSRVFFVLSMGINLTNN